MKIFYTDEEYLDILKVRKKSIQSMNDLLERKNGRMKNIHSNIEKDEKEIERIKNILLIYQRMLLQITIQHM